MDEAKVEVQISVRQFTRPREGRVRMDDRIYYKLPDATYEDTVHALKKAGFEECDRLREVRSE